LDTLQSPTHALCSHCGNPSRTTDFCSNCSRPITGRQVPASIAPRPTTTLAGDDLANGLTILAGTILAGGLFFALYVWAEYGTITSGGLFGGEVSVSNPYAKVAAFAIAANSVIWAALLAGVSRSIRNTIELAGQISQLRSKQA
jgi:hypothetical protein